MAAATRRAAACAVILAAAAFAAAAWPQPGDPAARSKAMFEQGRALADAGKWNEACPMFQVAHDLNATNGTALQLANCYERTSQLERAVTFYDFIVANKDRDSHPERIELAAARATALRKELAARAAPTASATAAPSVTAAPTVTPSAIPTVTPTATVTPSATTTPSATPAATSTAPATARSRTPAYVALGVGGVGLVVGGVVGAMALSQASDVKSRCTGDVCPTAALPDRDAAVTKGWISNVALGVGVVGVAVGVVLLVRSRSSLDGGPHRGRSSEPPRSRVTVSAAGASLAF